jgi:hypothetical protein
MRSARQYSNVTFTKRVDHDGGRKRPGRALTEPAYCPGCGAVYAGRHWSHLVAARVQARQCGRPIEVRVCPSCRQARSGAPHGFLHVDGDFFTAHRAEIELLLRNEVDRARAEHPLDRALAWEALLGDGLLVTTTTEHLAQRLGRALRDAYDGELHFGFSHENRLAHIWWRR